MPDIVSTVQSEDVIGRLINEGAIGMTQAAKLVGTFRDGRPTCSTTITRWCLKGVRLADDRIVKLESFRLNGRLCTSKAALIRFIQAQNKDSGADPTEILAETPAQRNSKACAASRELDALLGVQSPGAA